MLCRGDCYIFSYIFHRISRQEAGDSVPLKHCREMICLTKASAVEPGLEHGTLQLQKHSCFHFAELPQIAL